MVRAYRHPTYWFDDGSVIVRVYAGQDRNQDQDQDQDTDVVLFRIHERLLSRHSRVTLEPSSSSKGGEQNEEEEGCDGIPTVTIPPALGVQVDDFTSLLAHLYHDIPLSAEAPFGHVASVLRASSPEQLDIPTVHTLARSRFVAMFPSGPRPFVHQYRSGAGNDRCLEEALGLSVRYDIVSIRKGIYYSIVTTMDFEPSGDSAEEMSAESAQLAALALADLERCQNLMKGIVEHFTPVLFEPPVTPHMSCTNVLADKWFPLVVQGSIANDSVYKPLEVLEQLKQIDWASEGLCMACVREKREEWTGEQEEVWKRMDGWLGVSEW